MALTVDSREHDLLARLSRDAVPHRVATMDVGDLAVSAAAGGAAALVLERKTWADFAASIVDGRYAEQKARLKRLRDGGTVVGFLFEGRVPRGADAQRGGLSASRRKGLLSAQLSVALRDGFPCLYSAGLDETVAMARLLTDRCAAGASRPLLLPPGGARAAPAADVLAAPRLSKKHAQYGSARAVYVRQLMCVSRVSQQVAEAIAAAWPSQRALRGALRERGAIAKHAVPRRKTRLGAALEAALADAFLGSETQ